MKNPFNTMIRHVASYVIHLALVAVVGWAASHGFHISVPVIPASALSWSVFGFIRLLAHNVGRSLANGKLEAQLEGDGSAVINQFIAAAEGKDAGKAA